MSLAARFPDVAAPAGWWPGPQPGAPTTLVTSVVTVSSESCSTITTTLQAMLHPPHPVTVTVTQNGGGGGSTTTSAPVTNPTTNPSTCVNNNPLNLVLNLSTLLGIDLRAYLDVPGVLNGVLGVVGDLLSLLLGGTPILSTRQTTTRCSVSLSSVPNAVTTTAATQSACLEQCALAAARSSIALDTARVCQGSSFDATTATNNCVYVVGNRGSLLDLTLLVGSTADTVLNLAL